MNNKITVKTKKLHPDAVIPQYAHEGDAGFDLVAVDCVDIKAGETKPIPTGLAFEIPEGYEIQIRPRSGISSKTPLRVSNAPGTIDSGFRGEVKVLLDNTSDIYDDIQHISKGDRIAQGVLQRVPQAEFIVVNELSDSERGAGGFGSSGVKA